MRVVAAFLRSLAIFFMASDCLDGRGLVVFLVTFLVVARRGRGGIGISREKFY